MINNELNNFKSIYLKNLRHKKDRLKAFKPNLLAIFIVVMDCLNRRLHEYNRAHLLLKRGEATQSSINYSNEKHPPLRKQKSTNFTRRVLKIISGSRLLSYERFFISKFTVLNAAFLTANSHCH